MIRRTSELTDEELNVAKELRKNALKGEGADYDPFFLSTLLYSLMSYAGVDLASIARSSAAVSTSPTNKSVPIANGADVSDRRARRLNAHTTMV